MYYTYEGEVEFKFSKKGLEDIVHDKYIIQAISFFILGFTGFFIFPIMLLFFL